MRLLIGLTGFKGSGKSTFAHAITWGLHFKEYSFAEPLKLGIQQLFGLTDEQILHKKEEIDSYWQIAPRTLFQVIGTDVFREYLPKLIPELDQNFWIRRLEKDLQNDVQSNVIISDVRFENEAEFIRNHKGFKGVIIRVTRPDNSQNSYSSHKSELNVNKVKVDYVMDNDSNIDNFQREALTLVRRLMENENIY